MGFWHTGYIEFHEDVGLEGEWKPVLAQFRCSHCGQVFATDDELRRHRFESHPLHRPVLILDGKKVGNQREILTRKIRPTQVEIEGADRAVLNGQEIALSSLGRALAKISNDVCSIVLSKNGVVARFELEIRVASEADLRGVEVQFERLAASRRLDMRAIEEFIRGSVGFKSAIGYCDGICAYLYGLLAKERAGDSSLPYEKYAEKYARAAEELAPYDRSLSHTIAGLIELHFNHFQKAELLCPYARLGRVAGRFAAWVNVQEKPPAAALDTTKQGAGRLESLVTDWHTERILRWASRPLPELVRDTEEIETLLKADLAEFDRVKLHILLGELHAVAGNAKGAVEHAKALRNLLPMEKWAEALIRKAGENN